MTIVKKDILFISELKVKFKVLNIHWEQNAISEWYLQYKNFPVFYAGDKFFITREEDSKLIGKEVIAHISISIDEAHVAVIKEKSFLYKDGLVTFTGIVEDEIKCYLDEDDGVYKEFISYKLNSIFPIEISDIPKGAKIGDWVTVKGEAEINLPNTR